MDDSGVSSNLAFIIASGILLASIGSVYTATDDLAQAGSIRVGEQILLQNEARALRDQLLKEAGLTTDGFSSMAWSAEDSLTDGLLEVGLLNPELTQVEYEKLINLRLAKYAANSTDDRLNYEEAATLLGLDTQGLGFHIRAKPALDTVDDILHGSAGKDQNLRIAYIGNASKGGGDGETAVDAGLVVSDGACSASPLDVHSIRYNVSIFNGGLVGTQFFTVFKVYTDYESGDNLATEPHVSRQGQTYMVPKDETVNAWVDFNHGPGDAEDIVKCDGTDLVQVEVWDSTNLLRLHTVGYPAGTANVTTAPGNFYVELDDPFSEPAETVTVRYAGGLIAKDDTIALEVRDGDTGVLLHADSDLAPNSANQRKFTFSAADLIPPNPDGEYNVTVTHEDGIIGSQLLLVAAAVAPYTPSGGGSGEYDEDPALQGEVEMLDQLAHKFCPFYYNDPAKPLSTQPDSQIWAGRCSDFKGAVGQSQGDVYPDLKNELEVLVTQMEHANETPRYDLVNTIVVGSNVAHNSMTSGNFKWPLQRWVDGGGTLIVFGSPAQSTNWLNPVFGIKETTSSGGLSTPDADHPLLNVPEALPYDQYDSHGYGWEVTSADDDAFTAVVKEGEVPVTVVSEPGAYGDGNIVLTTWLPYDVTGSGDPEQGMKLMNNFLMQGYRDLFLDYGPALPAGVPVIPALGFAQVQHPQLDDPVSLRFTIYVFPYSN